MTTLDDTDCNFDLHDETLTVRSGCDNQSEKAVDVGVMGTAIVMIVNYGQSSLQRCSRPKHGRGRPVRERWNRNSNWNMEKGGYDACIKAMQACIRCWRMGPLSSIPS